MASISPMRPRRILCPNFNDDEVKALRSLCELLHKYLKHPWQVVSHGEADLLLVNLDAGWAPLQAPTVPVVGCALRPRSHPPGTIHAHRVLWPGPRRRRAPAGPGRTAPLLTCRRRRHYAALGS